MNKFFQVLFSFLLLQLIVIKSIQSSTISSMNCKGKCSSSLSALDWTGQWLQFDIENTDNLDGQDQEIGIALSNDGTRVVFTCGRRTKVETAGLGMSKSYPNDKVDLIDGKSIYVNDDQLWCNWTITREDNSSFPLALIEPGQLIVEPTRYQVTYNLNETLPINPVNFTLISDLLEQFKGYNVIGNSRYLLFSQVDYNINFALAINYEYAVKQLFPKIVTINLISDVYGLKVSCDFSSSTVTSQIVFAGKPFWNNLVNGYDYEQIMNNQIINGTICQWSVPNKIEYGSNNGIFELKSAKFDASIVADMRFKFYTNPDFQLIN